MNKNRVVIFMMVMATIIMSSCTDSRSQQTNQNTDETGTSIHASQLKGEIGAPDKPCGEDARMLTQNCR